MGSMGVLVVGEDYEDQLDKFQSIEWAEPENRHWVLVDRLETSRKVYKDHSNELVWGDEGFFEWARKSYNIGVLEKNKEPDFVGAHHNGWIRINEAGEVVELIHRCIPGNFFDYVIGCCDDFPLKKDRSDAIAAARESARIRQEYINQTRPRYACEPDTQDVDLDDYTFTSSAAKRDIDFDAVRLAIRTAAEERWDYVAAASKLRPWTPFDVIWEKYCSEKYSSELRHAALAEWEEQSAVKAIIHAMKADPFKSRLLNKSLLQKKVVWGSRFDGTTEIIDSFRVERDRYASGFGLKSYIGYAEVIMNGEHLENFDENQLFESIPEESAVTSVSVHC